MIINETRKAIIELIEPYMDKTLSEGCLITSTDGYAYIIYATSRVGYIFNYGIYDESCEFIRSNSEIIGHYDITAILKYIGNHNGNFQQTYKDDFIWMTGRNLEISISDIAIPNKPLHLYDATEEYNLLELLKKLG